MTDLNPSPGKAPVWLIEWPGNDNEVVRWWNPVSGWMRDANKATHFSRKQDADSVLAGMLPKAFLIVTEHIFMGTAAPAQAPTIPCVSIPVDFIRNCGCPGASATMTVGDCADRGICGCAIDLTARMSAQGLAVSSTNREAVMQELADQAQELDMGYSLSSPNRGATDDV
jgi:hypothetical protein